MAELEVPDEAWDAFRLELADHHGIHDQGCVRAIAGPVVAAVLRDQEAVIAALPVDNADVMATRFRIRQQLLTLAQDVAALVPPAEVGGIHREGGTA